MFQQNLLILDPNKEDRKHFKRLLKDLDIQIFEASSGIEALAILKKQNVECCLISAELGDMNPVDLVKEIRSSDKGKNTSLILTYESESHVHTVEALKAGAQDSLVKGKVTKEYLRRMVLQNIEKIHLQRALEIQKEDLVKSQGMWQSLFAYAPDFIVVVDKRARIVLANKKWGESTPDELRGDSVFKIFPEYFQDAINFSIESAFQRGETSTLEVLGPEENKDDTRFFETRVAPIYSGEKITSVVLISRDITQKKKTENEIVNQRHEALKASKIKSEFLANMSHEIRTPLNCIIGSADLLSETHLTEEQNRYVQLFQKAGKHLLQLINDILDLSKIEAGALSLNLSPFDVEALALDVADFGRVFTEQKKLAFKATLNMESGLLAIGDADRIRQVLLNLINNAIKFTNEGHIELKVECTKTKDPDFRDYRFSIIDTGIGIPENRVNEIFENFVQADKSVTRKYGGTGLGLSISKKLVEKMEGKIVVTSKLGEGSCFAVSLKLPIRHKHESQMAEDGSVAAQAITPKDKGTLEILVVDDLADNRFLVQAYLKDPKFKIDVAENGEQAVQKFQHKKYDVILMDMEMPVKDGYTATREIRQYEKDLGKGSIPIVALTAHSFQEHKQKALESGCSHYLVKPFKKADLLKLLTDLHQGQLKKSA